ncbi:NUDIX hydrolase [Pantoea stewartii]|uniref:NUDIX hydrolase n=1 Tax=Pantoea stewartii TaxID=66269 RepID=UPI00197E69CD|nr:NUDIX hydrolase [Pantoea stewartii]
MFSTFKSNLINNFKSLGRSNDAGYPLDRFNTQEEDKLCQKQLSKVVNLKAQDPTIVDRFLDFMARVSLYQSENTSPEVMSELRKTIPIYSCEIAEVYNSKMVFRGMHLSKEFTDIIKTGPLDKQSQFLAHSIMHGFKKKDGSYYGRGVTSVSTVKAVALKFAKNLKAGEEAVLINLEMLGDRPKEYKSGAKGIVPKRSSLPDDIPNPQSEHEIILDITNRYEISNVTYRYGVLNIDMKAFGADRNGVDDFSTSTDRWKRISNTMGSTPGGIFKNENNQPIYVKVVASESRARNEILASRLYALAGIDAVSLRGGMHNAQYAVTSLFDSNLKNINPDSNYAHVKGLHEGFITDVWLANWDVVGENKDNIMMKNGQVKRIDVGGALLFRAQNGLKGTQFSTVPNEITTMLDARVNNASAQVFCALPRSKIIEGIKRLSHIENEKIIKECMTHGPGKKKDRMALAKILIERKNWLVKEANNGLPHIHIKRNDNNQIVSIKSPSKPSPLLFWQGKKEMLLDTTLTITPGATLPVSLNHAAFRPWQAPSTLEGWRKIQTSDVKIKEPEFIPAKGKRIAAGAVIIEPDLRIWLCEPTNHFGGQTLVIPKGTIDKALPDLQVTAVKEAFEETGLHVKLTEFIGDYERTTTKVRYYLARRASGTPADMGWESQSVKLMSLNKAYMNTHSEVERKIFKKLYKLLCQ